MPKDDFPEVLLWYSLPPNLPKIPPGDVAFRRDGEDPLSPPREVRMQRDFQRAHRRQALDLDAHGVGDEEVPVRVLVDELPVLRVQGFDGDLDVRENQGEREDERPDGRQPDP